MCTICYSRLGRRFSEKGCNPEDGLGIGEVEGGVAVAVGMVGTGGVSSKRDS